MFHFAGVCVWRRVGPTGFHFKDFDRPPSIPPPAPRLQKTRVLRRGFPVMTRLASALSVRQIEALAVGRDRLDVIGDRAIAKASAEVSDFAERVPRKDHSSPAAMRRVVAARRRVRLSLIVSSDRRRDWLARVFIGVPCTEFAIGVLGASWELAPACDGTGHRDSKRCLEC
jgi:hypothetical protein